MNNKRIKTTVLIATIAIACEASFAQCLFPSTPRDQPPPPPRYYPQYPQYHQPPPPPDYGYGQGWRGGPDYREDRGGRRREEPRRNESHRSGKWSTVANLAPGGSAKEVSFSGRSECKIEITGGSVGFRTVVVRRGGGKKSITINQSLAKGQSVTIPIDRSVTGIRISDTGSGSYRVVVK